MCSSKSNKVQHRVSVVSSLFLLFSLSLIRSIPPSFLFKKGKLFFMCLVNVIKQFPINILSASSFTESYPVQCTASTFFILF